MSAQIEPKEVFLSYAPEDEKFGLKLEKHLKLLERERLITTWHKGQIGVGKDLDKEIGERLSTASIIVLLLSASFVASDACYSVEMSRAIERHEAGDAFVIPVVLRPMGDWSTLPFGKLQSLPSNGKPIVLWSDRDDAWASVARGIRSVLRDGKLPSIPPPLPAIWNIPYPRNRFFMGRDELLDQLSAALQAGPQAISGLGGIGKTNIAIEYAYQHAPDYQTVLWAQAESKETLVASYVAIAELLKLPEKNAQEQRLMIEAVKAWLQSHRQWLLILDNADDLMLVREFLPLMLGGHLLLTTRAQATGKLAHRIEVDIMPPDIGILFLLRRASLLAPTATLVDAPDADQANARKIYQELGGLPLALDQAGAYIETSQCSLADYQSHYQMRRTYLLQYRGDLTDDDHPLPVATTWSLSFEKAEQKCPAAGDLLRICAFLAPDAIPEEIITQGSTHLGPLLSSVTTDPFLLDEAISALGAYSLLRRNRDRTTQTLSIHRLVQAVVRDALPVEEGQQWKQRAVLAVNNSFPNGTALDQWEDCERWLPHGFVCAEWIEKEHLLLPEAANLLNQMGCYLRDRGRYNEAQPLYERALKICEHQFGAEHPLTAGSLNNLALLYQNQGKYEEALPVYKQALEIYEHTLGAEHPNTAMSLNNLALLYQNQGKYEEALPVYKRALEIYEHTLGAEHPSTARSLHTLGTLYYRQGKYKETEPLYKRALEIYEHTLGAEHPNTAGILQNLALLYYKQGKYEEALRLYKQALAINEHTLGAEHPQTAGNLNDLALLYERLGKYEEALKLYKRALAIHEHKFGAEHPVTAIILGNLGALYEWQGKYKETEPLYKRALKIFEHKLGAEHPGATLGLNYLAALYEWQGKCEEALPVYKRALEIQEYNLAAMHPETDLSLNYHNQAGLYQWQGKYEEALALYKRVLEISEPRPGAEHPSTAGSLNDLAALSERQGEYEEALLFYRRAAEIRGRKIGAEHPRTPQSLNNLALLYKRQGEYKEALALYKRALEIREQKPGAEHPNTQFIRKIYEIILHKLETGDGQS